MSEPKLLIEYVCVNDVVPNSQNPRIHGKKQVKQIAASIKAFGFVMALLVDECLQIIAGHGRWAAAKLLGMTHVPVVRLEHLSENQKRALMLADNRLTENSTWDQQLLGQHFKILSEAEITFDLETTGFEMGEIDMAIENLTAVAENGKDPADVIPEKSTSPVTQPGDLWLVGQNRVLCGDGLLRDCYQAVMQDRRANAVFADPPYNVQISGHVCGKGKIQHREFPMASGEMDVPQFTAFLSAALKLAAQFSHAGSVHYVCMDWRHASEVIAAGKAAYSKWLNLCVWAKSNAGMGSFYRSQHELIFVFENGSGYRNNIQLGRFGRSRTNVWNYPGINSFARATEEGDLLALHPTVKPVALVADAILDCSARGDIILDAFLGSGTTLIAAERTGRRCCGIELDPLYVDTIVRRWQNFTNSSAVHEGSGQTFSQREQEAVHVPK